MRFLPVAVSICIDKSVGRAQMCVYDQRSTSTVIITINLFLYFIYEKKKKYIYNGNIKSITKSVNKSCD